VGLGGVGLGVSHWGVEVSSASCLYVYSLYAGGTGE